MTTGVLFQLVGGAAAVFLSMMLMRFRGQVRKETRDTIQIDGSICDEDLRIELSKTSAAAARMSQQRAEDNDDIDREIKRISGGM